MSEELLRQELARVQGRLERERRARLEAEAVAEKGTRELYERQRQLELLHLIADAANSAQSLDDALQVTLDAICEYTGWPIGHAYLTTRDSPPLLKSARLWHLQEAGGFEAFRQATEAFEFRPGVGLPGRVLSSGRGLWIVDVTVDNNFPRAPAALAAGVRGGFAFPVLSGSAVVAVLEFFSRGPAAPDASWLDISARVGTQLGRIFERVEAAAALREGEARFRQVVENIHEAFWMTEAESNRVLYVSPRFAEIWGQPGETLYADSQAWRAAIHPADRSAVGSTAEAADHTYRIVRPDGTERWIRHRVFPVKGLPGAGLRLVSVAEDITDRKKLEEQFLRAQRMEAIGTLASGVAHDLNNILSPMLISASMLKENALEQRDLQLVEMIEQGARRGTDIIKQLLTFSRGLDGDRAVIQPGALFKEVTDLLRATFARDIRITEVQADGLWGVTANATQLHQVLMNLCVNARDAMPRGGTLTLGGINVDLHPADLHLHADAKPGRYVALTVSDTGQGMPPEVLARIFDPFFTTKEQGKGTGLGLSTALGIVKSNGGFMTVYSEPGHGSIFKVYLPAVFEPAAATGGAREKPGRPRGRGELILIVDDEAPIRTALSFALEEYGYRTLTAANGREGLLLFVERRQEIALIFSDVMMPVMGGVEFLRSVRALEPSLKMIAATGLEQQAKRAELLALGVPDVLNKPCEVPLLLQTVRRLLGNGPA